MCCFNSARKIFSFLLVVLRSCPLKTGCIRMFQFYLGTIRKTFSFLSLFLKGTCYLRNPIIHISLLSAHSRTASCSCHNTCEAFTLVFSVTTWGFLQFQMDISFVEDYGETPCTFWQEWTNKCIQETCLAKYLQKQPPPRQN